MNTDKKREYFNKPAKKEKTSEKTGGYYDKVRIIGRVKENLNRRAD